MLRTKRRAAGLCALLLALAAVCAAAEGDLYTGGAVTYQTDTAEYGRIAMTMLGNVEIAYPREVNARYEGTATATFVRYAAIRGAEVKQGDVLAVVQGNVSQAEVEQARLALLRAREDYAEQTRLNDQALSDQQKALTNVTDEKERARAQLLLEQRRLSSEQYVLATERSLRQLEKAYEELSDDDREIEITAPVDGIVKTTPDYTVGDIVQPDTILATLYDTSEALLGITSRWGTPPYGASVWVQLGNGASATQHTGTVVGADNMLSSLDKTGGTYVRLDDGTQPKAGQQVTLYFDLFAMEHVLLIDQKALHSDGSKRYVYLLKDGVRQKQYVTVAFVNSTEAWILDGLAAGDVVTLQ